MAQTKDLFAKIKAGAICSGMDTDIWYPNPETDSNVSDKEAFAQAICHTCPVEEQCGDYALATGQKIGVWGGMTEAQRRRVTRRRRDERLKAAKIA